MSKEETSVRNNSLDYTRGLALLWIVIGHYIQILGISFVWPDNPAVMFLAYGNYIPVYLFMVISGYFLANKVFGSARRVAFLKERTLAILPGYYILLVILLLFNSYAYFGLYLGYDDHWGVNGPEKKIVFEIVEADQTGIKGEVRSYSAYNDTLGVLDFKTAYSFKEKRYYVLFKDRTGRLSSDFDPDQLKKGAKVTLQYRNIRFFRYRADNSAFKNYAGLIQNYNDINDYKGSVQMLLHTWFLAFLVQFYLVFWILARVIKSIASGIDSQRRLFILAAIISIIFVYALRGVFIPDFEWKTHRLLDIPLYGSLMAMLSMRYANIIGRAWIRYTALALGSALICGAVFFLARPQIYGATGVALIVLYASTGSGSSSCSFSFFLKPLSYIGRKSLITYLWHWPLGHAIAVGLCFYLEVNVYISLLIMTLSVFIISDVFDRLVSFTLERLFKRQYYSQY